VVIGGLLILSALVRSSWNQLDRLQREHAAIKSESFYLGVTLRSSVRSLNGKLLKFGMSFNPAVAEEFLQEASELQRLITTNWSQLAAMPGVRQLRSMQSFTDLELLQKIDTSYRDYLERTRRLLSPPPLPPELDTFEEVYLEVQVASTELLDYCDQLVGVQSLGFLEFLAQTQKTLAAHKRLLQVTMFLILILGIALAVLVYRGMIAPLRVGLTRSQNIIERQEKLASLGILASGVAHEIRNPLTAIKFRLFSLKNSVPVLNSSKDATVIENEINRLDRIVKDFCALPGRQSRRSEPVRAESIVADVHHLMSAQLERSGIRLVMNVEEGALVQLDPDQFKQELINLLQNAAEAMSGKEHYYDSGEEGHCRIRWS
jgi:signal transduction histidine kinase